MQRDVGRRPDPPRVLGPYQHGPHRFTLEVRLGPRSIPGARETHSFGSEAEALAFKKTIERGLPRLARARTFEGALKAYREALKAKGNKEGSIDLTIHRVTLFFRPILHRDLGSLKPTQAQALYSALVPKYKVDTHRNMLAEAKSFLRWCVRQKWVPVNALEGVEGQGRRKRGKEGLYTGEARKLYRWCLWRGGRGDLGAVAVLMELVLGMRAMEICTRRVRDVDGDLLWIPSSKTKAGRRTLEVPERLAALLQRLAKGRDPEEYLFPADSRAGLHTKDWPRAQTKRLCASAKVPIVCAHALRGTHASIAREMGVAGRLVAETLGHESEAMHEAAYARPEAVEAGRTRRALVVLEGGR